MVDDEPGYQRGQKSGPPRKMPLSSDSHQHHSAPTTAVHHSGETALCHRCNNEGYPTRILDVIERRAQRSSLKDWLSSYTTTSLSCSCCNLLQCARRICAESRVPDNAAYFYFLSDRGQFAAENEQLEVLRITDNLGISLREPRKSCKVPARTVLDAQAIGGIVDLSMFKESIHICHTTHAQCNSPTEKRNTVVGFRVIDCQKREVVPAPDGCTYAALSYVWGPPSVPVGDLQNLPQTVSDAMTATMELGIDFLWVDRYCIDQTNEREKHSQILQMGLIYGQAEVTIVAIGGKDPSYGLPGISSRPSRNVAIARLGRYTLHCLHEASEDLLAKSVWNTRGWTFQEFVLSKRRLVFTDQHVFLECRQSMVEEWPASAWKRTYDPIPHENMGCNLRATMSFLSFEQDPMMQIFENIERYSQRRLTYSSDTLNGILGVLSMFESSVAPVYHVWGIPYYVHGLGHESQFDLGWIMRGEEPVLGDIYGTKSIVARRNNFPSWSWAGWKGVPIFLRDIRLFFDVGVQVETNPNKSLLGLEDFPAYSASGAGISASHFLHLEGWTHPLDLASDHESDGSSLSSPYVRFSGSNDAPEFIRSAACSEWSLKNGNRSIRRLSALMLSGTHFPNSRLSICCLVIENTGAVAERFGVVLLTIKVSEGSVYNSDKAISKIRERLPMTKRERFRLG